MMESFVGHLPVGLGLDQLAAPSSARGSFLLPDRCLPV